MRRKAEWVARELLRGGLRAEPGKAKFLATRGYVVQDWSTTAANLRDQGEPQLAREVEGFVRQMPAVAAGNVILRIRHAQVQMINLDRGCFADMLGGVANRTLFPIATEWRGMDHISEVPRARTGQLLTIEVPAPGAGWP